MMNRFSFASRLLIFGAVATTSLAIYEYRRIKLNELSPENRNFSKLKVMDSKQLSPTSRLIKLSLQGQDVSRYMTGKPLHFVFREPRSQSIRAFTPIHMTSQSMEIIVRTYDVPYGEVARYLTRLEAGQEALVHGPHVEDSFPELKKNIGMIANGTGIAAIYQILELIPAKLPEGTKITVLYANRNEDEMFLRNELEATKEKYGHIDWKLVFLPAKRIDAKLLKSELPPPGDDTSILVCGSPRLMRQVCGERAFDGSQGAISGYLRDLGYTMSHTWKF